MSETHDGDPPASTATSIHGLAPSKRFGLVLLSWALLALAQPGVVRPDGFGHLAFFAIGPWVWAARQGGRKAFLAEWLAHALGLAAVYAWMIEFIPAILIPMSLVPALYPALAGVVLRRCAAWPLALLAPAAWMAAEVVRWTLPVPLSFGWFRLGMLMHDTEWLVGSAAWFGTWGLTWTLAALGGFAADVVRAVTRPPGTPSRLVPSLVFGLGPLGAMIGLSAAGGGPRFVDGPDVLIVQPGIEQEIKSARRDPLVDLYVPQVSRTLRAIYETRPEGATGAAAFPDVVLWGETFLPGKLATPAVRDAFARGARPAPWARSRELTAADLDGSDLFARDLALALLGRGPLRVLTPGVWQRLFDANPEAEWVDRVVRGETLLPPGTAFLSGVEAWTVVVEGGEEQLRSVNGVAVWSPDGSMSDIASKVHVVPGGESSEPLRFIPFVVDVIRRVANVVPDFVGEDEPTVLTIPTRERGSFRAGIAICYDNAFDDPFTTPLRRGPVDLFVVASNEAWYGSSAEMDHMLAFSRIAAAAARRSIVRATNSGISAVVGPDGRVRDLLTDADGRRKMLAGVLRARVPVPDPSVPGGTTFFVRTEPFQAAGWGILAGLVLAAAVLMGRRDPAANPPHDG